MRLNSLAPVALAVLALAGCAERRGGGTPCGIAMLAGPTILLSEFATPGQALSVAPRNMPEHLVARIAAGPAFRAVVGMADTTWVVGVEGSFSAEEMPGYGVLVVGQQGGVRGVMLFTGDPIRGAPVLGQVSIGSELLPLIGIQLPEARYEDPACPFFPDSLIE